MFLRFFSSKFCQIYLKQILPDFPLHLLFQKKYQNWFFFTNITYRQKSLRFSEIIVGSEKFRPTAISFALCHKFGDFDGLKMKLMAVANV